MLVAAVVVGGRPAAAEREIARRAVGVVEAEEAEVVDAEEEVTRVEVAVVVPVLVTVVPFTYTGRILHDVPSARLACRAPMACGVESRARWTRRAWWRRAVEGFLGLMAEEEAGVERVRRRVERRKGVRATMVSVVRVGRGRRCGGERRGTVEVCCCERVWV